MVKEFESRKGLGASEKLISNAQTAKTLAHKTVPECTMMAQCLEDAEKQVSAVTALCASLALVEGDYKEKRKEARPAREEELRKRKDDLDNQRQTEYERIDQEAIEKLNSYMEKESAALGIDLSTITGGESAEK